MKIKEQKFGCETLLPLINNKTEELNQLKDMLTKFGKKNTQEIVSQRLGLFQERAGGEIPEAAADKEIKQLKELGYMH